MGNNESTGCGGQPGQTSSNLRYFRSLAAQTPQTLHMLAETATHINNAATQIANSGQNAYKTMQQGISSTQPYEKVGGGAGDYFGGDDSADPAKTLKEYRNSLAAATKDRLVRSLARIASTWNAPVDASASLEEIARVLETYLPNKEVLASATGAAHEAICQEIAKALNDEFTPEARKENQLIDTTLGAVSICQQVSELIHSFAVGVHTEFLQVYTSLKRVLNNIEILDETLRQLHANILGQLSDADLKIGAEKKIADLEEVFERAQRERKRQMVMLHGFLRVTLAPAQEELALAMREESDTHELIRKLKLTPGTSDFANSLAMLISGFGTVAAITARVDKALRAVGMDVKDYLASADIESLERALDAKLMSGVVKPDDVGKFIQAASILKENFHRRTELAPAGAANSGPEIRGGTSTLDRRVEKRKTERKLIVQQFIGKTVRHYDALLKAVETLGPHLGKEVPLSDKLGDLRNALARLGQSRLGALNLELALIGLYGDAPAREKKETFMAGLRDVQRVLSDLLNMDLYRPSAPYFAAMQAAIDDLVRTIDYFSDVIAKKYGEGEQDAGGRKPMGPPGGQAGQPEVPPADRPEKVEDVQPEEVEDDRPEEVEGGQPKEVEGGQPEDLVSGLPEIARTAYDLTRSVNTFLYFFYVARVRANLQQTRQELAVYGEKYKEILGDAVAARLRQLQTERNKRLGDYASTVGMTAANLAAADKAKKLVEEEFNCKIKFYNALQALDLYMKAFTDGIVSHPDEVVDIKRLLDGVSVIGRWFVEETGDDVAAAFDTMDGSDGQNVRVQPNITTQQGAHYYEKVAASPQPNNLFTPGIPQLAITMIRAEETKKLISRVFDNFQALKNIMNAFVRIGEKFGGKELRREVFMSPAQIYKALTDYLKISALSLGVPNLNAPPAAAPPAMVRGVAPMIPAVQPPPPPAAPNVAANYPDVILPQGNVMPASASINANYDVYFSSVIPNLQGNFTVEDQYFTFIVKAMGAKVLTVLGVFDLFERPSPIYDLTPTRMIIGGASYDSPPEVIPEATELYFRLPRLVEFYKNLFAFDESGRDVQISMLPEMEGVFSGVIRLIFQRVDNGATTTGEYSDLEIHALVREINAIYEHFRGSAQGSAISEALSAFVQEVNRRYGLIKKADWLALKTLLRESRRAGDYGGQLNKTNYAILPGEDEYQPERMAPSDQYMYDLGTPAFNLPESKFKIDDNLWVQWNMVKSFRVKLDKLFEKITPDAFTTYSFATAIRQGELEIRRATNDADKMAVVVRLIQGSGNLAGIDVGKAYMFHETVVVGLNLLNAMYTILATARQRLIDTDIVTLRKIISNWMATQLGNQNAAAVDRASIQAVIQAAMVEYGFSDPTRGSSPVHVVQWEGSLIRLRAGAPWGTTYADLYNLIQAAFVANQAEAVQALPIYCFDNSNLMEMLLGVVVGLTNDFQGLVSVTFPQTAGLQMRLSFDKLRGLVQGLMSDLHYYMDLFRPHMPKNVIQKFEDRLSDGSLNWLEERLMDGMVQGLADDASLPENLRPKTLDWMSRKANETFTVLTGFNAWSLSTLPAALPAAVPAPGTADNYEQYGRLFAKLIYYDAMAPNGNSGLENLQVELVSNQTSGIANLISVLRLAETTNDAQKRFPLTSRNPPNAPQPPPANAPPRSDYRISLWYERLDGFSENCSLLILFNQLVAHYLSAFYDSTQGKIYQPLIDTFANGAFSAAVMNTGCSLPDLYYSPQVANVVSAFGRRGDPLEHGILCQSLALILRRLAIDRNPANQVSEYLVATLSEIPIYLREGYRANLPIFIKLFNLVQKQGEFYRKLMDETQIQVGRPFGPQRLVVATPETKIHLPVLQPPPPPPGQQPAAPNPPLEVSDADSVILSAGATALSVDTLRSSPPDSVGMKLRLSRIIDGIVNGCYTLSTAATSVCTELSDGGQYLETYENSIAMYTQRNNHLPLMPLSSALTFLKPLKTPRDGRLMPIHRSGSEAFKLVYGVRKLINGSDPASKFTLADAPGVQAAINNFNGVAGDHEKLDLGRYEAFLTKVVSALRYVVDTRHYRGGLAPPNYLGAPLQVDVVRGQVPQPRLAPLTGNIGFGAAANTVYQLRENTTPQMVLAVTENSDQRQEMKKLADATGGATLVSLGQDREKEWFFNILDLNIIPINVHAMMRDTPLAPLYNYVYTFEQMVCLMFGQMVGKIEELDLNNARNTRQAFLKLLLDPYAEVSMNVFGGMDQIQDFAANALVSRIFRGDDTLMMGRPKFLSDQLFNKALFGSLIPTPYVFDETGPPGAGRMEIGRDRPPAVQQANAPLAGPVAHGVPARWGVPPPPPAGAAAAPPGAPVNYQAAPVPARVIAPAGQIYGALTYIGEPDNDEPSSGLKQVQMGINAAAKLEMLHAIGKLRFDTRFVRNLFFISNVQRVMRLKLNQELTQYRNVLVSDHSVINPGVTEYGSIPPTNFASRRLAQFGSANETTSYRRYDNETNLAG